MKKSSEKSGDFFWLRTKSFFLKKLNFNIAYLKVCPYFCNMNKILLNVIGITYSQSQSGAYALLLEVKGEQTRLPIIIGEAEAQSIAIAIEGHETRRPLTHDLFKTFAKSFDINITEVVINRFKEGLFYSELHCIKDGEETIIDARTSDAVALALRFDAPIYANSQVVEEAGIIMDDIDLDDNDTDSDTDTDFDTNTDTDFERYDIKELEHLLKEAIEVEDYAKASVLRDIINDKKQRQ
jgi:bifunctional DNase/RNase